MKNPMIKIMIPLICCVFIFASCKVEEINLIDATYSGEKFIYLDDNTPRFLKEDITNISFESYSELDELGRCGVATACVGKDIMPTEERGAIGQIKPSGWQLVKYDIVDGKYLYNRCHLIGYQLTGENANEKNLITGTRSMNVDGMLPFENMVADYVDKTNNHVMYRVTPVYKENNLVAKGVQMEAFSVEDDGKGISFNVFVFNAQPGIEINYEDGTSSLIKELPDSDDKDKNKPVNKTIDKDANEDKTEQLSNDEKSNGETYILNTNTMKIHYPTCPSIKDIKEKNKEVYNGTKEYFMKNGYTSCDRCKP